MEEKQKIIPSRQPISSVILLAVFGSTFTLGSFFILIAGSAKGTLDPEDAPMLALCFAFGFFFSYATFKSIQNNHRLKNGYYQQAMKKNYHYKGDEPS